MKASIHNRIRILAVILLIALGGLVRSQAGRAYCRSEFRKYFQGLGTAEARVNPVGRLLFSVLLTRTKADVQTARAPQQPAKQL
jgi:hypothetical protein